MSSSFVKDCSNASGSSSGNKTFIIIVSNETGNLNLNENQLQSLLATHGADASSQVSVMQMGGGGNANSVTASVPPPEMTIQDSNISSMGGVEVPALPLNFMLEGFPATIPVEGVGGGYAELPLDADALQRLENVLHTEEAKQILGGPLLDIVKDPTSDHLEKLISSSSDSRTDTSLSTEKKKRPPPKRRSQRQMDKAEREEVEKILAENQLMLQKEREELQRIQMEQEQQRIQMEQEQQRIEGEREEEQENNDDDDEDEDEDSDDSDDSESDSEVDDVEKDTTFKLDNDLKKGKKPKPASKEKLKAVTVKKTAISVGKGKTGGGKKGPDDITGKENVPVKKPPNTGGGKGKGTGGKKVPTSSVMKQKGGPKSTSNKKGKIISTAVVKTKKGTAITKKKVAGVAKKTPKSIGKKLLAKPKPKTTTTVKKRKQNIKNEELVCKEEKEEEEKTDIKIDNKVSKVVKMKKLSVKVKKLKDNLVWSQNKVKTDESSAAISVTKEEENDFDMGIKSVQGNGHIKNVNSIDHCEENGDRDVKLSNSLHNQVQQTTTASAITTTTTCITSTITTSSSAASTSPTIIASSSVITEDSDKQKGSTSPNNVAIVKEQNNKNSKISNSSLSNKVQSTVNSNDSYINTNNNSNCNVNNNYNNAVSQSVKLNFKKLDTDACDDNNLSDEKSDIDSYNKCSSQILMHTQNFSDEAISPTSHRQADGSQARTPNKSAWNEQTDSYKKNSVHGMPNFNYSDDSSVKEISKKTRNKMQNDVEVLNPKEVLNFEVANTNYQIDVGDSSIIETNDPKMDSKTPCSSVDGVKNLASKKKASFENELNRGTFAGNKFLNAKFKKHNNNKKVSLYSPTIPKSLKNFKIPLKNSANKRPPLISQLPSGKPYEHLQTSSNPSYNTFISSPLDSYTSHSSPHDSKNTGSQIISINNNNNINVHISNTHIADDPHTPVTSKKTPIATNSNMLKSDEKNDHLLSNLNFTPQKNNESNKIFKKSQNLKIVKKTLSNLDSSFKVETKIGNKDSSSNKANLETSISPNVFPLKNKNIEKMSDGQTIIRRSRRPIKKKTFGDDILFLDEKTRLHSDDFDEEPREEVISNDEDNISNESDAEDDDNDFENEVEDDDPERLWCICEKPHNNRFMICCDRCEDWFHGSCVGVTKSMGKQMEQRKVQWICPNCKKAERAIKGFSSPKKEIFKSAKILPRSPEVQITNEISLKKKEKSNGKISKKQENDSKPKEKTEPRVLVYEKSSGIVLSGTSAPTLNILPDWLKENPSYTTLQPAMMNSIQTDPKTGIKRINLEAFGLKPAKPKLDRSFSFQEKIDSVPVGSAKKEKVKSSIKLLKHSEVLEIEKGKKAEQQEKLLRKEEKKKKKKLSLSLSTESPSPKKEKRNSIDLSEFYGSVGLKKTPVEKYSSRSVSLSEETAPSSPSSTKKSIVKDFVRDGPLSKKPGIKSPEPADKSASQKSDTMKHRESVRKFLYEALHKRKSEVPKEFKDLTEENLKLLCKEIEEQFFMTFNKDVGFKYKTRCRSLIFNIKDSKNGGLFRQILSRTIPPEKLANMTSEELASKELAEWREREEKKELEAIQKHELERIALGNQYIMKSHKGEIVIDKEDLGTKTKDTESVISLAPDASKAVNSSVDTQEDEDTINHRNHIYNPSCKICQASELQNISKEELLEAKEELNIKDEEDHKDDKERRKSTSGRRESESSSSHHHSKHKKKEKERDRSRERRHSHKSKDKDKDRERDKDRHRDRGDNKDKEKSRRHRHSSGDKDRSRRHRSREGQSREKDSSSKDDSSTKDEKKIEDRKRRHSGSRNEDRKRHIEEIKDEIKEKKIVSDTELLDISIKFKGSSSEDSKSPLPAPYDPNDSHSMLPLDILLPPLPPLPSGISELATLDNKSQENQDRSPATPPYPIVHNDNDYDDEESMLSPATPPLPDDDDDDEDRLTPPPQSLPAQKPLEDVQIPIWKGVINMPDVAKFSTAAFEVSGKALFFTGDVPSTVEVVGRISPDTVWTYIAQVKKSGSKEILVVRFQPSCEEEKVSYIALYSYLSSKKRYGVIGNCEKAVKDFYIVPLASHQPIPQVLLPLDGPGFEESRPHMLIGVIIRTKHKRVYDPISGTWTSLPEPLPYRSSQGEKDSVDERSYTPPPTSTPKPSSAKRKSSFGDDEDNEEVLEVLNLTPTPENADGTLDIPPTKEKTIDSAKSERESMLAELNRQIERDRKELSEMQKRADKKMEENEKKLEEKEDNTITIIDDNDQDSEVTSSDVGGPEGSQETFGNAPLDTSKINIPSNLHEILASIKEKEKAIAEKENEIKRRLNMPEETSDSLSSSSKDVDLRLLLGTGKDQDLRVFTSTGVPPGQSGDQDFRSREPRDPRIPRDNGVGALPSEKGGQSSLSSLSDADLVAKAVEMEVGPTFNPTDPGIHHMYEQRVPPEHPTSHGMMPPPGGPPPPHNMVYPPEPNPAPPNIPYPPHPMPPPGYRPQGPYMSGGPPPNGPPMGMPHGPPPPPFIHDHPQHPPGPPIPSGHPGPPPTDPACPPLYGPHRGSPSERMPVHGPYEEYPPYPQPRHVDDRRHHRMESGRHSQGGSWDSRRDHRDRDSNSFWSGEEGWDRRGDGNVRRGNMNKNYDRFPTDKKRRWKEGGGGGRPQHYRGRWGDDDNNEDWSGGDNRNWRNGGGKRPRRDRNWYDSTDRESGQKEIDY